MVTGQSKEAGIDTGEPLCYIAHMKCIAHVLITAAVLFSSALLSGCGKTDEAGAAPAARNDSPVAQSLGTFHSMMNAEFDPAADYYIYVQSASWCGPCKAEMPELIAAYPEMKAAHVELILIGLDGSEQEALGYLQSFKAPFPGVHYKDSALSNLPGFAISRTVPHATIVDRQGKVIAKGHGSLALKWKQITDADRAEK